MSVSDLVKMWHALFMPSMLAACTVNSLLVHQQSLEAAAYRSQVLKKKTVREGVTSNLAASAEKLLQDLLSSGIIGKFELDSACLTCLARLPAHQQTQVSSSELPWTI